MRVTVDERLDLKRKQFISQLSGDPLKSYSRALLVDLSKVTVASENAESITRVSEGSNGERRDCYAPDAR